MNRYERKVLDCKVGIKAFQNICASASGFSKMLEYVDSQDAISVSSIFYGSVIRYAKPFLNSNFEGRNIRYAIKNVKKTPGFDNQTHDHLISVRNTLVAHDDFDEISPRLLTFGMQIENESFFIPTSIAISNKCILSPESPVTVQVMHKHAQAACQGAREKLVRDLEERKFPSKCILPSSLKS